MRVTVFGVVFLFTFKVTPDIMADSKGGPEMMNDPKPRFLLYHGLTLSK